jgi:hypothetical protein
VTIINLYKGWYIATACVCVATVLLLLTGILKTRGLVRSSGLIVIYYLYLLLTAMWAEYPNITIWYVLTESIYIVIFALFYLLSMNFSLNCIIDFFVYMVPPAIIIFVTSYVINPESARLGGYVLTLLPFVLLFSTLRLITSFSIRNVIFITACLLMLVLGMFRTPLLIAGFGLLLIFVTITKRRITRYKLAAVLVVIGVVFTIAILVVQPLRIVAAKTIVRITYQDMVVGDGIIEAETPDAVRWLIYNDAFSLYKSKWLFGMGYMNFMPWFGAMYDFSFENAGGKETVGMNLHNTFQTWGLEGGLPCLGIATLLLWKYFSILRRRIRQSKNDSEKSCYKLFVIGMVCLLVAALFGQIHQTPMLFILLGIVYAFDEKKKNSRINPLSVIEGHSMRGTAES